jgi:endonuclease/exonuclease/phosphatase family metal-dependent hydrolase
MERICTYALFKNKITKQLFWVFNTHFDHIGDIARIQSVKLIIKKIKELNKSNTHVILMGDLNLRPESNPIVLLSKVFNDSRIRSFKKPFGPIGTFNGFKLHQPVTDRIDYIFTSNKNTNILKYAVLSDSQNGRYPSDHLPVFVEIEFKNHN